MDGLGGGDDGVFGVRPLVEVHHRVLAHHERRLGAIGGDAANRAVRQVLDVVERRHVHPGVSGQPGKDLVPAARAALVLPVTDDFADGDEGLLAIAQNRAVDEVGQGLGVERGMTPDEDERVGHGAIRLVHRDLGQVQGVEHVGVAQLRRQ